MKSGIIETVTSPGDVTIGRIHYIPHHALVREDSKPPSCESCTTPRREMADRLSMTACMLGPTFGQNILDILLRFRLYRVAVTADIEKAFLMVSVAEEDRDVLHFL